MKNGTQYIRRRRGGLAPGRDIFSGAVMGALLVLVAGGHLMRVGSSSLKSSFPALGPPTG